MKANQKIQIRRIYDLQGNVYDIFDYMVKSKFGYWLSKATYFKLEDALQWHKGILIEDKREFKEN